MGYGIPLRDWHNSFFSILVKLRPADGGSKYSGRLEVSLLREWGTESFEGTGTFCCFLF